MESYSIIQKRLELYCIQEINNFLEKDRLSCNLDVVMKSVGQSLFWSLSLLDFYKDHFKDEYHRTVNINSLNSTINGLSFVRNRVAHQFCEVVYQRSVATFPMEFPKAFYDIAWKPIDELPTTEDKYSQGKLANGYKEKLQDKSVRYTLEALKKFICEFSEKQAVNI